MSKNLLFRLVLALIALAAAVMWLLTVIPATAESMSWFSLGWSVVMVAGSLGVAFLGKGLIAKAPVAVKKANIMFGAGFVALALTALVGELAWKGNLVLPIITVVVTAALVLGIIATGGKKWDEGDNHAAGYKSYRERKDEENRDDK